MIYVSLFIDGRAASGDSTLHLHDTKNGTDPIISSVYL